MGGGKGGRDISIYAAPGRAKDLCGLPLAFIEVGSADALDEDVALRQGCGLVVSKRSCACGRVRFIDGRRLHQRRR